MQFRKPDEICYVNPSGTKIRMRKRITAKKNRTKNSKRRRKKKKLNWGWGIEGIPNCFVKNETEIFHRLIPTSCFLFYLTYPQTYLFTSYNASKSFLILSSEKTNFLAQNSTLQLSLPELKIPS